MAGATPDGVSSDEALATLRERLLAPDPVAEARRRRYAAALHTAGLRLDAVLRLADEEINAARSDDRKAVERGLDLADVWEKVDPHSLMSRRRAAAILREVLA